MMINHNPINFELYLHPKTNNHALKFTEAQSQYTIKFKLRGHWRAAFRDIFHDGSPDHFWQCIEIENILPENQQYLLKDAEWMMLIRQQITAGFMQQMEAELAGEMHLLPWLFKNQKKTKSLSRVAYLKKKQEQQELTLFEKAEIKFHIQSMLDLEQQVSLEEVNYFGPPKRKNPYQHLSLSERDKIRTELKAKQEELERRLKGCFIINPSITAKYTRHESQLMDISDRLRDLDGDDDSSRNTTGDPEEAPF